MSGDFLDSNVLIYILDVRNPEKQRRAEAIVDDAITAGTGLVSTQVVQETLNVLTNRLPQPLAFSDAIVFYESTLQPLWKLRPSDTTFREALRLKSRYHLHFYDALIVAPALQAGCERLISEDFQHGQRFENLLVHNPFV